MIWIGTSGFQYPEWKGIFYPAKMAPKQMLAYYSERFNTTEVNYTFRRMPTESILTNWSAQTPPSFRFSLKAPQVITHIRQLRECETIVQHFAEVAQVLGDKLGATLFQLPPSLAADVPLLNDFLAGIPPGMKAAFEFRHESWFSDETFEALRKHKAALCVADSAKLHSPVVTTAGFAYFRLRDEGYQPDDIARWAKTIQEVSNAASDIYVYFKHEEQGLGPEFARELKRNLAS